MAEPPTHHALTRSYRRLGSVAEVASEYGVAFETARQWLRAAGVELRTKGRPSENADVLDVDELTKRYRQGESVAAIASSVGVSPNTVRNRLLAAGVQLRQRRGWKY